MSAGTSRAGDQLVEDPSGRRFLRLSSIQENDIDRGIAVLGDVLRATARKL